MKFRKFMLVAYDEETGGLLPFDDCFHCEFEVKGEQITFDEFIENYIRPAANVVFSAIDR